MELIQILVIVGIIVILLLAIVLFRVNTRVQMKVSFNMDDECNIYNQKGLVIFKYMICLKENQVLKQESITLFKIPLKERDLILLLM